MRLFVFIVMLGVMAAAPVRAGDTTIIAVVNDEVISSRDLEERMAFVFATTQLENFADVRARLAPQLLRTLLDEKLRQHEAAKAGITVSDEDVQAAISSMEAQRGMLPGEMLGRLEMMGVPKSTYVDQVRTQLLWNKLVVKKLRGEVKISDDEVERERTKRSRPGVRQVLVEQLSLPVDRPENDADVRALSEKLVAGIRAGAPFESVARELGAPKTDASTLAPAWVAFDELDPALQQALADAPDGTITNPVRTPEGYSFVKLLERRIEQPTEMPDADVVRQQIFQRKMELGAEKYLRQIRRDATIDVRLPSAP